MRFRLEFRRQLGALAEEVLLHLFEQKFLGFGVAGCLMGVWAREPEIVAFSSLLLFLTWMVEKTRP